MKALGILLQYGTDDMPITLPVTGTKVATTSWGNPITNEVNRLTTQSNSNVSRIATLEGQVASNAANIASFFTPTWMAVPLTSGWSWYGAGYSQPQYAIAGMWTFVRGLIRNDTGAPVTATTVIATIPADGRPPASIQFATMTTTGAMRLNIATDGTIRVYATSGAPINTGTFVSIENISYARN